MEAVTFGWHFVPNDMKLAHSGEPVESGKTYRVKGRIVPCENGLHGSLRLIDALQFAPGEILTRCRYDGEIAHEADKLAASERTILWLGDVTPLLHDAACVFAEGALRVASVTDPRSWSGEITDKELDAAWAAASAAARAAASAAASAAAWAAAWAAASAAAWDAASAAAWAAARDAARDAASAAARDAASAAAWAAARDAAWDAAWDAQNDWLECAVREFAGVD